MKNDEDGFYLVVLLICTIFILLPAFALVTGIGEMMVARSEAQILTDAIALDVANESVKQYQNNFMTTNSCGDVTYTGSEPYLSYVGDSSARDIALRRIGQNRLKVLGEISVTSIEIRDPYIPAAYTSQRIPDSLKAGSHSPYIKVVTKSTFAPLFKNLWKSSITITRTGTARKYYPQDLLNLDRIESSPSHEACPRPKPIEKPEPDDDIEISVSNFWNLFRGM